MSGPLTRPGWYPNPSGGSQWRWWDGYQWTEFTHPVTSLPATGFAGGRPPGRRADHKPLLIVGAILAGFIVTITGLVVAVNQWDRHQRNSEYLTVLRNPCSNDLPFEYDGAIFDYREDGGSCSPAWDASDSQLIAEAEALCDIERSTPQEDINTPPSDSHLSSGGTAGGWRQGIYNLNVIAILGAKEAYLRELHPNYPDEQIALQLSAAPSC